jgi:cytochrome c553
MRILSVVVVSAGMCAAGVARADDSAEDIWAAKCKGCHGADGKAKTKIGIKEKIDDLTTAEWQAELSDQAILQVITSGSDKKGSKMKAFKDKLTSAEIASLVPYIRAMKGK